MASTPSPLHSPAAAAVTQSSKQRTKAKAKAKAKAKPPATTTTMVSSAQGKPAKRPKLKWRTRDSQNSQLYNLQLDINDLQQEIQHLHQMRDILSAQRLNRMDDRDGSYVKVVHEYHRMFQHGFHTVVTMATGQRVNTMEFLSRVMDERVSIGRFVGLDMMRDQWMRYSIALSELDLRYISSKVLPEMDYVTPNGVVRPVAMVSSKASYESLFTLETIELMFPHLLQHSDVVTKLLGHKFRGIAHFDFVFDTNSHRVIGYDFRLDLLESFARLLHDPEDLCLLFEGAKISEEFLIGDLNVYPQTAKGGVSISADDEKTAVKKAAPWNDPIVSKYASRRQADDSDNSDTDMYTRKLKLHSKLTNILDPVDRVPVPSLPPVAVATQDVASAALLPTAYPVAAALPQRLNQQQRQYQQLSAGFSSRPSRPWQLQLTSILSETLSVDADDDSDEETKGEVVAVDPVTSQVAWPAPHLPSISYFPVSTLGGDTTNIAGAAAARAPLLGKRSNPFAVPEFPPFPQ